MIVARWLCAYLLLANLAVFFYFIIDLGADEPVVRTEDGLQRIKLLSELPQLSLDVENRVEKKISQDATAQIAYVECHMFTGIKEQRTAKRLADYLLEQGYAADQQSIKSDYLAGFRIALDQQGVSAVAEEIAGFYDQMDGAKVTAERGKLYINRSAAENDLLLWAELGFTGQIVEVYKQQRLYQVITYELGGQKLSNKIKTVVQKAYAEVKIEKKLCEGVAKP